MVNFFIKKSVIPIVASLVLSMLLLWGMPSTAFAASRQATVTTSLKGAPSSLAKTRNAIKGGYGYPLSKFPIRLNSQVNNQYKEGNGNNSNNSYYWGIDQGNSGNLGYNAGNNQDNASNSGDQVNNQKSIIGTQINRQVIRRGSGSNNNNSYYWGVDQGNSGNQGYNVGNNQDNASNSGNQVNNQANAIGKQFNAAGSKVNNQGNTIGYQENHNTYNLLPDLLHSLHSLGGKGNYQGNTVRHHENHNTYNLLPGVPLLELTTHR
ncbi:hypothetical protein [Ktedonobacter racemifer]|uniref:PPE family protein n=1 Tax=Ktedonobacter racemifer DSM 44963 TaxID=485913 RepID=D6TE91_KTERA|nr:hypothetical protein [Ktedonobacter racemifer]EFH88464.1 hypothetical protein Krac_9935 [Ktedonobacter racemifer DSM 44963]